MKTTKIYFWLIPALAGVIALLSETGLLPTDYFPYSSADLHYWADLFSFVTAIGGTYLALRLPFFPRIKSRLTGPDEPQALRYYLHITRLRLIIVAIAVWGNAVLYYAASYSPTPKYCLLIALLALFFCHPSARNFAALRPTPNDNPAA